MIPPTASLVKYENPVLVSKNTDKKGTKVGLTLVATRVICYEQARTPKSNQQPAVAALGSGGPIPSSPKGKLPPVDQQKNQQTEEILNAILPPRLGPGKVKGLHVI